MSNNENMQQYKVVISLQSIVCGQMAFAPTDIEMEHVTSEQANV